MNLEPTSISAFADHLAMNGMSENTIRSYRTALTDLALCCNPATPLEAQAARYLTSRRAIWSPKTTCVRLTAFRSFAKWSGEPGFLADYKAPTPPRAVPHPIPEGIDGVLRMLALTKTPTQAALVAFTGLLGLRVGEARSVTAANVNEPERTLTVRGKGDRSRTIPISTHAWDALQPALRLATAGRPIVDLPDRTARNALTSLGKEAGLARRISSHDMRATLATAAYNGTRDLRVVQELLGHASSSTTECYTGVSQDSMRSALEGVA